MHAQKGFGVTWMRATQRWPMALGLAALPATAAHASLMSPELEDTIATGMAWVVLIVVPILGITLFLLVHVLPEKIAAKRHHPQKDAIHMLCLLSLFFGGLLWPLAWLWAYSRPTAYRRAYGTDKHPDYFVEMAGRAERGELSAEELHHLAAEFDAMAAGHMTPALSQARRTVSSVTPAGSAV